MTTVHDIGWGSYQQYEGPFFKGSCKLAEATATSPEDYKRLAVITATEGGRYDAINMYDRCILSVGLIQWCEASMFGTSNLLGYLQEQCPAAMGPVHGLCSDIGYTFKEAGPGKWRFFHQDGNKVETLQDQQRLFLLHSDGTKGSWDDESGLHARRWASVLSSVLLHPLAQAPQVHYTAARLLSFVMPVAKNLLFDRPSTEDSWMSVAQAAYLSFAANLPAVASKQLVAYMAMDGNSAVGSPAWVKGLLRQLTFGPEVAIYPARYNAIRPVLETLYGVDLPDFAVELKLWRRKEDIDPACLPTTNLDTVFGLQHALVNLNYDLGPSGVDGVYGNKTVTAIMSFQSSNKLKVDGVFGPRTRAVMLSVLHKR